MVYLLITSCLWSLSFAVSKLALTGLTPLQLSIARLGLGFLTLALLFSRRLQNMSLVPSVLAGIFQFGFMYVLYISSLQHLPSGVVAMLTLTTPLFMYLVGIFMGSTRVSSKAFIAIFLSIVGGFLCLPPALFQKAMNLQNHELRGVIEIILSNISFATGNVLIARRKNLWTNADTAWAHLFGMVLVLCLAFLKPSQFFVMPVLNSTPQILMILYLGVIPTGIGFWLWNKGVSRVEIPVSSVISNLKGPLALVFGFFLLGEPVSFSLVIGSLSLFLGAVLLSR